MTSSSMDDAMRCDLNLFALRNWRGGADKLSQLAEEIAQEAKAQVFALRVDCADARSVREAFEGVLSLGPVEVLVYNACDPPPPPASRPTPFLAVSPDAFHRAMAVCAAGAFHCAQQVRIHLPNILASTCYLTLTSASVIGPSLMPLVTRRSSRQWWKGAGAPSSSQAPRRPSPDSLATLV